MSAQSPDLSITADTVPGRRGALTASPSQAVPATNSPTGEGGPWCCRRPTGPGTAGSGTWGGLTGTLCMRC